MFIPEKPILKPTSLNYRRYMFKAWADANNPASLNNIVDIYDQLTDTYLSATGYIEQRHCNIFSDDEIPTVILTTVLNEEFAEYTYQVAQYVRA